MNTYLAIITTVLVVTQIIRLIQNAVQLHRQNVLFKKQLGDLADMELTEKDFEAQKKAYRLIVEYLEKKLGYVPPVLGGVHGEDRCVCCGNVIPEGRMVCPNCLVTVGEDKDG
jgi:hypothetical protein